MPCGTCSRRGRISSCNYVTTPSSAPSHLHPGTQQQPGSLQSRISELENLVVTLMNRHSLPSPALTSPNPSARESGYGVAPAPDQEKPAEGGSSVDPGTLRVHQAGNFYMESGHWEDILTKIRGLTEDFVPDKVLPGSHLIYGPNHHANRHDILAAVPPRSVVDRLMALHFDSYIITPCKHNLDSVYL